ncbi:NGFI-A-binding protein 2 isoform X2 [Denticeps clupeoides]|uniref:NGFI-A-binding protein 2 isoform X2 n=1 Tax=Denticeps clupeoides TaxID=299321 RepID=UPI0010A2BF6C|nr:NGFI-A-binding protein 2-like isoform X2 [Denticeps clupeoides]
MSLPRTLGELQLYSVLQQANLLAYYATFIQQGGDDVQQLCEAGEEEFLEIMALVGMATKPLHVRRLQKALRDWAANPTHFNQPLTNGSGIPHFNTDILAAGGTSAFGKRKALSNGQPGLLCDGDELEACLTPLRDTGSPCSPGSQVSHLSPDSLFKGKLSPVDPQWLSPDANEEQSSPPLTTLAVQAHPSRASSIPPMQSSSTSSSSPWLGRQLDLETMQAVGESVEHLLRTIPHADPGEVKTLLQLNKKMAKTMGHIFSLKPHDCNKEEEIRKYSLIYGRFDSKRREEKQLTNHEMIINEAAAQFCIRDNALLLRRVELFSLARQVARECACTSSLITRTSLDDRAVLTQKRSRQEMELETSLSGVDGLEAMSLIAIQSATYEDSLTQDIVPRPQLSSFPCHPTSTPSPATPSPANWSRQLMQQTLMDEGLRLARMVSYDLSGQGSLGSESPGFICPELY